MPGAAAGESSVLEQEYAEAGRAYLLALFGALQYSRWRRMQEQLGFTSEATFVKFLLDEVEVNLLRLTNEDQPLAGEPGVSVGGVKREEMQPERGSAAGVSSDHILAAAAAACSEDGLEGVEEECCVVFEDNSGNIESASDIDASASGVEVGVGIDIDYVTPPADPPPTNNNNNTLGKVCEWPRPTRTSKPRRNRTPIAPVILRTAAGVKLYGCPYCPTFRSRYQSAFYRHQSIHLKVKPFRCDQCEFSCRQQYYLAVHKRIHTGERPYQCPHCQYTTSWKKSMDNHVIRKHNQHVQHDMQHHTQLEAEYNQYVGGLNQHGVQYDQHTAQHSSP